MRRLKAPWLVPVHVLLHYVPFSSVSPLPPILPIVLFLSPFVYTPFNADTNDAFDRISENYHHRGDVAFTLLRSFRLWKEWSGYMLDSKRNARWVKIFRSRDLYWSQVSNQIRRIGVYSTIERRRIKFCRIENYDNR